MSRPLALDLFACSGGSTTGLEAAGFDVIGVDHKPSQHWCGSGELHQADLSTAEAVEAVVRAFAPDLVSASPPCQAFSSATPTKNRGDHPNLIPSTRAGLLAAGVPAWIENVHGAPLHHSIRLCGSMFPETQKLKRHRFFELLGWFTLEPEHVNCTFAPVSGDGHGPPDLVQSAEYRQRDGSRQRRGVESVHEGSNARAARQRRETTMISGHGPGGERYAAQRKKREIVTVIGDSSQGVQGRERRRSITIAGNQGEGPGQICGQNRAGPECIRWREALGWIDGPKHRYSLAQAVPPAYARWLGERFLALRR